MPEKTPLYTEHMAQKATMVDFYGWSMPLHYGSQVQEHHAVRQNVGLFDVSHMHVIDVQDDQAITWLRHLLANDVAKLVDHQAQYSLMLNQQGGVIDDLIVYQQTKQYYRLVFNAATRAAVTAWLNQHNITFTTPDNLAIIAVQGPQAIKTMTQWLPDLAQTLTDCPPFNFIQYQDMMIARTGYTGEDGVEMILPADQAVATWQALCALGAQPCGLGARDTLRLEAGMCLSGADMDAQTLPKQANLGWVVDTKDQDRHFIGRQAHEQTPVSQSLVGLILTNRGVIRTDQIVLAQEQPVGHVTSGGFSPTLGHGIAFARIENDYKQIPLQVLLRDKPQPVQTVKLPFVRHGQILTQPNF